MLRDNLSAQGKLNTYKIMRARMQYHNTPISDIRRSPAQIVFNHQLRDFIPLPAYKLLNSQVSDTIRISWTLTHQYDGVILQIVG